MKISTASRYSHAAIYVDGTTIEATLGGVFSKSAQRLAFDQPTDVAILRSRRPLSREQTEQICMFARSKTGSLYALNEAITVRARSILKIEETRKQFCSRLVAQAYEHIGYNFINLRSPSYCTPRQLSLCKAFEKVKDAVRIATDDEISFAESEDPNMENQRQTFEWLNKVRALAKTATATTQVDIQTLNDVNDFLIENPSFDGKISSWVKESGYLEFHDHDEKTNTYRYNKELF